MGGDIINEDDWGLDDLDDLDSDEEEEEEEEEGASTRRAGGEAHQGGRGKPRRSRSSSYLTREVDDLAQKLDETKI